MADRQDKTFDPTPQRLRKAREEGNVFRSREIVSVGLLLTSVAVLGWGAPAGFQTLQALTARIFGTVADVVVTQGSVPVLLADLGQHLLLLLLPFFGLLMVMSIGLNVLQSGWNVSFKPLTPRPGNVSPLKGLKRIFSSRGLFEFAKGLIKIVAVGPLAYLIISGRLPQILLLQQMPLEDIFSLAGRWILLLLATMIFALALLSGADFVYEKWRYKEDLKMSAQEIKDEAKETEGNPEVKRRRFQMARELVRRPRLDHAVMQADVVVTNPTHYAVALRYDPEQAAAPRVLVKGIRKRALRIKELARTYEIPMVEDRPLARALYDNVPEMQEIPEDLYQAVATLLAEIYRRRGWHDGRRRS
ncbi:MAG: EscU/YscU/HrcU family type III secretion system export apparatus switch protein [Bacteroidetes bacterium]|nr:MAG: EscU/YscU/HrcU family type III secretion system export apparatus switch protein [Bacteroidota bacterium]